MTEGGKQEDYSEGEEEKVQMERDGERGRKREEHDRRRDETD